MKILGIHSVGWDKDSNQKESGVDIWRVWRPLEELKKHTDWQIDYQPTFIFDIDKYKHTKEFTEEELELAAKQLGKYDIIFTSYHPEPTAFALMEVVEKRYGTKLIIDADDDLFGVAPHNPIWTIIGHKEMFLLQRILKTSKYITTTTSQLKDKFQERSEVDSVVKVLPNYISDSYQHPPVDNGDKIVIGYFGGSSHYVDIHETKLLPAAQKLMHKYKNVYFKCVGQPVDYYLPRQRVSVQEAVRGRKWVTDLFPTLNMDIVVAPLEDSIFNQGKSDIKWQEATRAGAAFVGSDIGPYARLDDNVAIKVNNTEEGWYDALEGLVVDKQKHQKLIETARKELENRRLEDHWIEYKEFFEEVHNANDPTSK